MPKDTETTTVLRGEIGIPEIRVIARKSRIISPGPTVLTRNALQQALEGRIAGAELKRMQAMQADQKKNALDRK